jgi:hypothetical protein
MKAWATLAVAYFPALPAVFKVCTKLKERHSENSWHGGAMLTPMAVQRFGHGESQHRGRLVLFAITSSQQQVMRQQLLNATNPVPGKWQVSTARQG